MSEICKVYELLNQLLTSSNISKEEFQSKSLIRYSLVERILRVFLFKNNTKTPIDLYRILNYIKERHESETGSEDVKDSLEKIKNLLTADQLFFYKKIIEEIITFPTKLKINSSEFKEFTQENAFSEMESFLNKHIHINFFHMKSSSKKWDEKYFNESYIRHHLDKLHFEYSISSLTTMFKILKFFEYQGYTSKDAEALENCDKEVHGMISQKKLFHYLGFKGKEIDFIPTNLISSFIDSHIKEITQELYNAESLVNNFEVENNICFSLFLIKKIVKDYSFYFDKKPELEQIFLQLRKFKNWPIPVGNFGLQLYETIINELYFQGVTILNELRKTFYIDLLNPKLNSIETKVFTSAVFVYYYDDEKLEKVNDDVNKVDLNTILNYICKKKRKKDELSLREFMGKLFITLIRNSRENINSSTFKNIMNFLMQKKNDYMDTRQNMMTVDNEDEAEIENENAKKNFRTLEDNTKTCIDTLLKVITVGLDKSYDDFMQDVNMLVKPIIKISANFNSFMQANISPITDYRSFLKPYYADKKRITISQYVSSEDNAQTQLFDLYEIYKENFFHMFNSNFSHLLEEASTDVNKFEEKRRNIYNDYRLKIVLIEDKKVLSSFIENIRNFYKSAIFQTKFSEDYDAKWSKFISKKEDFEIKYTLYIVPFEFDNIRANNLLNAKDKNSDDVSYMISEYLSQLDHIYRYTIYIPWALSKESELTNCMYKINEYNSAEDQFGSTQDTLYSYLHEPLNIYVRDSEHVFNLHLYKITIKNGDVPYEKIFWKSVEIGFSSNRANETKNKYNNSNNKCNVTMECVDFLGIHHKDKDSNLNEKLVIPITPYGDYNLKIFNLFFRKDPPFCYNTSSNNGWLEVYMSEKKLAQNSNFIQSEFEYFKSVVIPQFELEANYRNYKVTRLEIKPESHDVSFNIKIDDFPEFNSKDLYSNSFVYNEITSLQIEEYIVNGNHMNVPIATFMPI